MSASSEHNPRIIGLTGSFGSGCSYIAKNIIETNGYRKLSLSDVLKELYRQGHSGQEPPCRSELQQFGDEIRKEHGAGYLAEQVVNTIQKDDSGQKNWVVDSIRNPAEVYVLRKCSQNFFLFGVFADKDVRWQRVSSRYEGNQRNFDYDDHNDTGANNEEHGQRVSDCFYEADIVLTNNINFSSLGNVDFEELKNRIHQYISLIERPLSQYQAGRPDEVMMAMAYAMSQRSSCRQRKVGAIIVDEIDNVISSGFNEVPQREKPCWDEYQTCYRKKKVNAFFSALKEKVPQLEQSEEIVRPMFKQHFRNLDICRALHAEENAIINLARHGHAVSLSECTLFTTTYPCRLCANKIAQLRIKRVVYLEPYPDEDAKVILRSSGIVTEFFEGITFRAYFRIYGEKK